MFKMDKIIFSVMSFIAFSSIVLSSNDHAIRNRRNVPGQPRNTTCLNMDLLMVERNVVVKVPPGCSAETSTDSICYFHCKSGYYMFAERQYVISICNKYGDWMPPIPICHPITVCEPPEPFLMVGLSIVGECRMLEAEPCPVTCADGFEMVGPPFIVCIGIPGWSEIPQCVANRKETEVVETAKAEPRVQMSPPTKSAKCPYGFYEFEKHCYQILKMSNGYSAFEDCKSPAHALAMNIKYIYDDMVSLMKMTKTNCIWTGINDLKKKGVWVDGMGGKDPYLKWEQKMPSHHSRHSAKGRDCVVLQAHFFGYRHHDFPCVYELCHVVCQVDLIPEPVPTPVNWGINYVSDLG